MSFRVELRRWLVRKIDPDWPYNHCVTGQCGECWKCTSANVRSALPATSAEVTTR